MFVNVGSEMAYRLPLRLLKNASLLWHSVKRLMSRALLDSTTWNLENVWLCSWPWTLQGSKLIHWWGVYYFHDSSRKKGSLLKKINGLCYSWNTTTLHRQRRSFLTENLKEWQIRFSLGFTYWKLWPFRVLVLKCQLNTTELWIAFSVWGIMCEIKITTWYRWHLFHAGFKTDRPIAKSCSLDHSPNTQPWSSVCKFIKWENWRNQTKGVMEPNSLQKLSILSVKTFLLPVESGCVFSRYSVLTF